MVDANDDAKAEVYRRVEVLTGPGRRRQWSEEAKARIVSEAMQPGAVVAVVARRWQVCPQQVFGWRREMRCAPTAAPDFVPIVAAAPMAQEVPLPPIEIELAGAVLRIAPGTQAALTTVLRAVRASVL
jgi:transposase